MSISLRGTALGVAVLARGRGERDPLAVQTDLALQRLLLALLAGQHQRPRAADAAVQSRELVVAGREAVLELRVLVLVMLVRKLVGGVAGRWLECWGGGVVGGGGGVV